MLAQAKGCATESLQSEVAPAIHIFFLQGSRGSLAAMYYAPAAGVEQRGDVLVVPAFAEEMNRCRAMVALQARRWAEVGVGSLVIDPFGTGDSAGEFADATWAQWRADLRSGIEWLNRYGHGCRALLGLRLGAIMAAELAREDARIDRLLLWQPVLSGKTFYTQFLRIRIAAEINLPDRVKSTEQLRQWSRDGQTIEVSGYEIGPALAAELDTLAFNPRDWPARLQVQWFEVGDAEAGPSPVAAQALETLGPAAVARSIEGPPFWHVHERELAPALIEATSEATLTWPAQAHVDMLPPAMAAASNGERLSMLALEGERLSSVLHPSSEGSAQRGVVIVVAGGPQYRIGAHRQFVSLARQLASNGWPTLRFDLRGMGDSTGKHLGYLHSGPDIRAAVDELLRCCPALREVVLIGECESASGILFYAWQDPRVAGAVLVNPWVRTPEGQAQVIVKEYYLDRLRQRDFWLKLASGRFRPWQSLNSLIEVLRSYWRGRREFARSHAARSDDELAQLPLPDRVAAGLARFRGRALLLMSGNDYIAREFDEVTAISKSWQGLLDNPRLCRFDVEGADHTLSKRHWKNAAAERVVEWMRSW